jgi:hypothetical protein
METIALSEVSWMNMFVSAAFLMMGGNIVSMSGSNSLAGIYSMIVVIVSRVFFDS